MTDHPKNVKIIIILTNYY